jgi:hypothetical protein
VDVELDARTLMEDALLIAIDQCNALLEKSSIELVKDLSLFKARLVGRNFKPKTDMPCKFALTQAFLSSRKYAT